MNIRPIVKVEKSHPFQWLWEPLESDAGFALASFFGGKAVYLDGRLVLFFSAKEPPWHGLLLCTDRIHHAALMADFPILEPHPVLPKWLYLPESLDSFESAAAQLVMLAKQRDPRMGVPAKTKKPARHKDDLSKPGKKQKRPLCVA